MCDCEKSLGAVIYKEILINDNKYIISRYKNTNNQIKYRCKKWSGTRWCSFIVRNTPREIINRIKEMDSYDEV